jgi:hypothetical protein
MMMIEALTAKSSNAADIRLKTIFGEIEILPNITDSDLIVINRLPSTCETEVMGINWKKPVRYYNFIDLDKPLKAIDKGEYIRIVN